MPRGRHRHSPPLHRLLPPSAVAGASVLCALGAWLLSDPVLLRTLVAAAAAAAVTGAVLMRSWDRYAGRRVAELTRLRASDAWKTEERIAELEADLDESRELRTRLDAKLRAKRVELAGLRNEHAALLRRYANAETERASALEGRRQLAIEAGSPKELPAAGSTPTPSAYLRAAKALEDLPRRAAEQQAKHTVEEARKRDIAERAREADEPQGKHAAAAGGAQHARPSSAVPATRVPVAAAIVPYSGQRRAARPQGGFDFFGTQGAKAPDAGAQTAEAAGSTGPDVTAGDVSRKRKPVAALEPAQLASVQDEDLADVVGEEALAQSRRTDGRAVGEVIDLTAHDETEQLDVAQLRSAIS
ncbi:hypothetical protein QMZ92_17375 [Streptomyces sp. HNM0645]|uniref:hypothetical protein n=1 Tax=Streptomyces sp. HNM0645 TaxID=2782343 RepID=UPI0024B7E905|nr:hypothetical protein [Streptomyces sp. HNM0645]MDI9886102.1 hypothetical protein [Streptomyces sp. HNM0645]